MSDLTCTACGCSLLYHDCGWCYKCNRATACANIRPLIIPAKRPNVAHYNYSDIEAWDVIDAWDLDFYLGNVIKYVARHKHKGDALSDLRKAADYLQQAIRRIETNDAS